MPFFSSLNLLRTSSSSSWTLISLTRKALMPSPPERLKVKYLLQKKHLL
jgi:hypothetical protein